MAKKLILCVLFWLLLGSPVFAQAYMVYQPEPPVDSETDMFVFDEASGQFVASAPADSESTASDATTPTAYDYINYAAQLRAANDVYDDGMISDTYLNLAKGLLSYVPLEHDYVFARVGQYEYIFATGDFSAGFSGSGEPVRVYELSTRTGSNNRYSYVYYDDSSFSLTIGQGLVYSNLAPYPTLTGADRFTDIVYLIALVIACGFGLWFASLSFSTFSRR